jgi:polysaccharide export outer membrane protein
MTLRYQRFGMLAGKSVAAVCILCGLLTSVTVITAETTVSTVKLEHQPDVSGLYLLIFYNGETPEMSIDADEQGLGVWLSSVSGIEDLAEGIELKNTEQGSWMYLRRAGVSLASVMVEKSRITIRMSTAGKAGGEGNIYRFGVGDVITISVFKEPELSGDYTVGPDGRITMPLIGAVKATGLTDTELKERITELLAEDYLVDPQISVTGKEYRSQYVYVTGAVTRSSRVPLKHGMALKDVLSEAGVTLSPGQEIVLTRTGGGEGEFRFTTEDLEHGNQPDLQDGDVLNVKEPAYFYIRGEIRRPGKYQLTKEMTLLEAISVAEGLTEWASRKEVQIRRKLDGDTTETNVNLKKVEEQRVPDPQLQPGDVILIKRRFL